MYEKKHLILSLFFLFVFLFTACTFKNEDKLLSQLIEDCCNLSVDYENTSEIDILIEDYELFKRSDEYYVNRMINPYYVEIVEKIDDELEELRKVESQEDFYKYYTEIYKLLLLLENEDNTIIRKTIISAVFIFSIIFVFLILLSILLFIVLLKYDKVRKEAKETGYYSDIMLEGIWNERRRISRELHDTICQDLRAIKIEADLMNLSDESNLEIKETIITMLSKSIEDLRSICKTLSPLGSKNNEEASVWQFFISSLENLIDNKQKKTELQFNVKIEPAIDAGNLNLYKLGSIFRIIQEAFSNIEKHSQAKNVSILIRNNEMKGKKTILIFVIDDGIGLRKATADGLHFGLINMNQRASELGADLSIVSEDGDGTKIRLEVPVE